MRQVKREESLVFLNGFDDTLDLGCGSKHAREVKVKKSTVFPDELQERLQVSVCMQGSHREIERS